MSRGKYSLAYKDWPDDYEHKYNCLKQLPAPWSMELKGLGIEYDTQTMMPGYDEEGFDYYGYSAFDLDGNFVGHGDGVDRAGYTESQYLALEDLDSYSPEHYYDGEL